MKVAVLWDDLHLLAHSLKDLQNLVQLLVGVSSHITSADQSLSWRNGRSDHRVGENPILEQGLPEVEGLDILSDDHGDDGRVAGTGVVAHGLKTLSHLIGVLPQTLSPLWFRLDDLQRGSDGGHRCRWHAGAEDQGPAVVLDEVDDIEVGGDESPDGDEEFAEGAHSSFLYLSTTLLTMDFT